MLPNASLTVTEEEHEGSVKLAKVEEVVLEVVVEELDEDDVVPDVVLETEVVVIVEVGDVVEIGCY